MLKKAVLVGVLACALSTSAFAGNASKEEHAGVGLGVVIGAAAGGPVGAIIGAAFGGKLGEEFRQRNEKVASLSVSLTDSQSRVAGLESDLDSLGAEIRSTNHDLQQARSMAKPEVLALLASGIEMDLLFRTDEYVLADTTSDRLEELAVSLVGKPEIQIRLDGFADERGDAEYNRNLSNQRAEYVRGVLVSNGVPASRITVNAHGESPAVDSNIDSLALERRVSMTLYLDEAQSFAANPR